MTTLVLAEKPSVARDIARVLGATRKGEGVLEGNGYRVTWALGHLVQFAEPDDYGETWAGRWSLDNLPMLPEQWRLRVPDRTAKQFALVKRLLNAPETERIVCATDAGREGEHIFRLIHEQARCRKPFERLWISSLTDQAIRDGFRALRPGHLFDPLAAAARARAQADWLVGMNLTRAYTVHNRVLCTIGRVQTPTLAMIVSRDVQIESFEKSFFYELVAGLAEGFEALYLLDGGTRIDDKETAERLQRQFSPYDTGTVRTVDKRVRHHRPPPLYDLTTLQRDANRRFGMTAAQVLEKAQALYETYKLISYPRTESRHLSEDMLPQLPGILGHLGHPLAAEALQRLANGHRLSKAYVDRTKLTDHHAIVPTDRVPPASLPPDLRRIYDLVVARFVAIFLPDQRVEETRVEIAIGDGIFLARGALVLDPGWKRVEQGDSPPAAAPPAEGEEDASEQGARTPLPPLEPGQIVHVERLEVREKETQPPRPYDDASLLAAMKNAGRAIEDDALASAMAGSGLGTPATRAETIEKLVRTGYVERQRKQIRATAKGRALIGLVAPALRSPDLTAGWEQRLKEIELGERSATDFEREIRDLVRELIPRVAQGERLDRTRIQTAGPTKGRGGAKGTRKGRRKKGAAGAKATGNCPVCRQGEITENARAYGCSRFREGCGFTIWKTVAGLTLTPDQVSQLVERGHTDRLEGFRSKKGASFSAALRLDASGKVGFDFDSGTGQPDAAPQAPAGEQDRQPALAPRPSRPTKAAPVADAGWDALPRCPKCGLGHIIEGRRGFGCDRYREGCDFVIWKTVGGLTLGEPEIRRLVEQGRIGPLTAPDDPRPVSLRLDANWQTLVDAEDGPARDGER